MVEFPSGHFGIEDLRTDIDAYNIFKMNNSDTINSFKSYYENMSDKKRFSLFLEEIEHFQQTNLIFLLGELTLP